ncbi:unnamed protein product [Malus baccata var. baccata]
MRTLGRACHSSWIVGAFLVNFRINLEEEVYMKLPPGHLRENEPNKVCRLHKAIYGLKQSPRAWYSKLSSVLASKLQWHEKVSLVSQFMHSHTLVHWEIVKRILRYLKGSVGRRIIMKNNGSNHILAYIDADCARNALDKKSITGFCTFVRGNLVTWKSKKQTVIARSSAEAEYRAMAVTTYELIWLKGLLSELGFISMAPMSLYCDNQDAMHIASNPIFHERTKHIEVDCHYIRAQVQSKDIDKTDPKLLKLIDNIFKGHFREWKHDVG